MHHQNSLKKKWLNLMLHFSAVIARYKSKLMQTDGPKIILYGFFILALELVNAIVSLPLYAFVRPEFFAGNDTGMIKTYRLRRVVSLSVLVGIVLAIVLWLAVAVFGVALFPGRSHASTASWDFNNPLAYHYDPTKVQIVDGTVVFKATVTPVIETPVVSPTTPSPTPAITPVEPVVSPTTSSTAVDTNTTVSTPEAPSPAPIPAPEPVPTPAVEIVPLPVPVPEPTPLPVPAPAPTPVAPTGPLLLNTLKSIFSPDKALAESMSCSATLEPLAPLVVASFDHWTSFSEIANTNGGSITYQLSSDGGGSWLYWNGTAWTSASAENFNTSDAINAHIVTFPTTLTVGGAATLSFRAKFASDCTYDVILLSLTADYAEHTTVVEPAATTTPVVQTTTSEENPAVIAVTEGIVSAPVSTNSDTTVIVSVVPVTPPVIEITPTIEPIAPIPPVSEATNPALEIVPPASIDTASLTNTTSLDTGTNVGTPTTETPVLDTGMNTSLDTNTTIMTPAATPVAFSVHTVIATTGTPGHVLYSILGVFMLEEGPDNGIVAKFTDTSLQQMTLTSSSGSSGNVSVGDHIIVLTYDGSALKLYVDGAVSASVNAPIVIAPPSAVSTSIGCVSAGFVLQALTLAEVNANYLECGNHAPALDITNAMQMTDDSYVDIGYTITDQENNFVSLPNYEYSLTGAFSGEERQMTEASFDLDHNGANGLSGASSGSAHTFVWNVASDLPDASADVYIRMRGSDGLITGAYATYGALHIDTKAPIVGALAGSQTAGAGNVAVDYTVLDRSTPVTVALELSADNGLTWTVPRAGMTGAIGEVTHAGGTTTQTITWNADENLPNAEGSVIARITATDAFGNQSITTSDPIVVDTRAPFGLAAFTGLSSNEHQILWHWSPAGGESNFSRYIITYGTDPLEVAADAGASVHYWNRNNDSDLLIAGTDRTIISGLIPDTLYYAKISAYDDFGHISTSAVAPYRTTASVSVTNIDANMPLSPTPLVVGGENITEMLSDTSTLQPSAPTGGFKVSINENAVTTETKNVALALAGGIDTTLMAISNHSDLAHAALVAYAPTAAWDLCAGLDDCQDGTHTVYVKYYTSFGVGSAAVSDSITLTLPTATAPNPVGSNVSADTSAAPTPAFSDAPIAGRGGEQTVVTLAPSVSPVLNSSGNGSTASSLVNRNTRTLGGRATGSSGGNAVSPIAPAATAPAQEPNLPSGVIAAEIIPAENTAAFGTTVLKSLAETRESAIIAKPEIGSVSKSITGSRVTFAGSGIPKSKVAIFIHSDQVVVYTTDVDEKGQWNFTHDQNDVELAPGEHTVFAVTYDPGSKVKSKPSVIDTFEVSQNTAAVALSYADLPTTLLTLAVLLFGALYVMLRAKKKQ